MSWDFLLFMFAVVVSSVFILADGQVLAVAVA